MLFFISAEVPSFEDCT